VLVAATQAHPAGAETPPAPVPPSVIVMTAVTAGVAPQDEEKENSFELALRPVPPGPSAATRAS
jgi:hypothetical protein